MIMRGNTTDYIQKKDTHVHCSLKSEYQNLEGELMFQRCKKKGQNYVTVKRRYDERAN